MYVKSVLHLWNKANLIMVDKIFDVWLYSISKYFRENF